MMHIAGISFAILPLMVAIFIVFLDLGWRQKKKNVDSVDLVMFAGAFWLFTHAFELGAVDLDAKIFWNKIQFIAIIAAPIGWYLASQTFIFSESSNKNHNIFIFIFLPIALFLIISSDWHSLLWFNAQLNPMNPYDELQFDRGIAYWICIGIAYYLVVISIIPFTRSAAYYRNIFGKQAVVLIFSSFLPLLGSVFDLLDIHLIPTIELTPMTFAISRMINIRFNSQLRVGDIVPVVRNAIIDNINDGIFVLDSEDTILDHNPAAAQIFQRGDRNMVGQPMEELWNENFASSWMNLKRLLKKHQETSTHANREQQNTYQITSDPIQLRPDHIRGSIITLTDITISSEYQDSIKASLQEKEELLREIHHYIKNNLQIVSSLTGLMSHNINEQTLHTIYEDSQNRIQAMALIHDKLYQTKNLVKIEFGEYISDLVSLLAVSTNGGYGNSVFKVEADEIFVDIDTGISCGLILNELLSNALKHAFPHGAKGEIRVAARKTPQGLLRLSVSDNGVGLPTGFDLRTSQSLGLKLVETLSHQLNGEISILRRGGATFILECPI